MMKKDTKSCRAVAIPYKKIEIISAPGIGFAVIDGIRKYGDGYFISHYQRIIYFVNNQGANREVLNTSKNEIFSAYFEYIDDQHLFVIPTLRNNRSAFINIIRQAGEHYFMQHSDN